MVKVIGKHLFILAAASAIFFISGYIGVMCEKIHNDLAFSTTIFGLSAASITAGFVKAYHILLG